jgi:transcriptional regulator
MAPGKFDAMLKGIVGFELRIEALRGTRKLGQHKSFDDRASVAAALGSLGRAEAAELMRP